MYLSVASIYDIIFLVMLLVVAFAYSRKGLLAGIIQFLGNLISLLGAMAISDWIAPRIFAQFFQTGFVDKVESTISVEGSVNIQSLIEKYAGFLPDTLKSNLMNSATDMVTGTAPDLASRLVDEIIAPLFTPIIAVVVFFVAFAVCKVVVSFLVTVLTNLNKVPLLGSLNKGLGFVLGLGAGVVDLYLLQCVVWAIIVITGGTIAVLNAEVLSGSIVYGIFNHWNLFY